MKFTKRLGTASFFYLWLSPGFAFENSKVLPRGVRSMNIKSITTQIRDKSDSTGAQISLAKPLCKELDFATILKGESGTKKDLLHGFLLENSFSLQESLGEFTADMQASIAVNAAIFSYGVNHNFTLAMVLPYYKAISDVRLGFKTNMVTSERFLTNLSSPDYNQTESANIVINKINGAISELNKKLIRNGYVELKKWRGEGPGDAVLAGKYRFYDSPFLQAANQTGFLLPTGRIHDPNILNDIPFGKGCYEIFTQNSFDFYILSGLFFDTYIKYGHRFSAKKDMRLSTWDESIEVATKRVSFKIGDQIDTGFSLQNETNLGFVYAFGYNYLHKFSDRYELNYNPSAKEKIETDSWQISNYCEAKIGYSGINAYREGKIPAPFTVAIEYKKHLRSRNAYINDFFTADIAVFF